MSDTKSGDDKTLSVNTKKTLTLKRPGMEQGTVRQNFSHGRTKSVVVETKKRKFSMPGDKPEAAAAEPASVFTPKPPARRLRLRWRRRSRLAPKPAPVIERSGMVLNELSTSEMEARRRALEGSKVREVEDRQRAIEEAKRRLRTKSAASASATNPHAARPTRKRAFWPKPNRAAAPRKKRAAARRSPRP